MRPTPGGQLGAGVYLFPNEGAVGDDGKRQSQRDAEAYGDGNAFRVFTAGLNGENIHDRDQETGTRSGTWPRRPDVEPYQHPSFDAVKDTMDNGGLREMKLAPHLYDSDARAAAMETLFQERVAQTSIQIAPPHSADGSLGHEFLDAIKTRHDGRGGARRLLGDALGDQLEDVRGQPVSSSTRR